MANLTAEQITAAETMSLDDLRALALKEAEEAVTNPDSATKDQPRDEHGKFAKVDTGADELDNSAEGIDPEVEAKMDVSDLKEDEPEVTIYRKEIDLGDGSGVQVFQAESLEELVDKLADAQKNASKKIRELSQKVKTVETKTAQQIADEEYVVAEKLKTNPRQTVKEIAAEVLQEAIKKDADSKAVQSRFVNTHPSYVPNSENGKKVTEWLQLNGYTEFTDDGLEKAYQSLKKSGLLELKDEGAGDATDGEAKDTDRIGQPKVEATQQRSQKRGSGISARSGVRAAVNKPSGPSEDELYKMPLDKLRELADKQMQDANQQ